MGGRKRGQNEFRESHRLHICHNKLFQLSATVCDDI